jgi:fumarylacetoacetase
MTFEIDNTHDAALTSWVVSANDPTTDFPIQNLPFARFRTAKNEDWRIGVGIGDQILDLHAANLIDGKDMKRLMSMTAEAKSKLRQAIVAGLLAGSPQQPSFAAAMYVQSAVELGLPCEIGDYTDFYTSIHHATNIGRQLRPDNPLLPNYKWVPIGYHGRASSIIVSGQNFRRPQGQTKAPDQNAPIFGLCRRLDYELELGIFIAQPNAMGESISMHNAEAHIFGVSLFNDWSARDIQAWEYQPLGPFLSKNFASTLSPWVVTMEALAPFRSPAQRPASDPEPLAYLDSPSNRSQGALDIALEVWLQTEKMRLDGHAGDLVSTSNYRDAYWTIAQLVAHHSVNGCNLRTGDLFGTGTLSGPQAGQGGSMMELSVGGKQAITLSTGETRTYLEDGDTIIMRGYCQREGFRRIGLGECRGRVLPAKH